MIFYLSIGSNSPDGEEMLNRAIDLLHNYGTVLKSSSVYHNAPYGISNQPSFVNLICTYESAYRPYKMLRLIKQIELGLGRIRTYRWGPRRIDIDIIEWNGEEVNSSLLTIPHPDFKNRDFVLVPLLEIEPAFLSREGKSLPELIDSCSRERRTEIHDASFESC